MEWIVERVDRDAILAIVGALASHHEDLAVFRRHHVVDDSGIQDY